MKITVIYHAQIRRLAGVAEEGVELPEGATVADAVRRAPGAAAAAELLFDAEGRLQPVILTVLNGVPAAPSRALRDGDTLALFSPVAGG